MAMAVAVPAVRMAVAMIIGGNGSDRDGGRHQGSGGECEQAHKVLLEGWRDIPRP